MTTRALIIYFSSLFTVLFSMGCATIQEKNPEISLRDAAERYWEMRMKDNYSESYEMEDKEGLPPFDIYKDKAAAIKKTKIKSYNIKGVRIEAESGIVDVEFNFIIPVVTKPVHQTIGDKWLYREGKWWHLFPL